MSDISQLGLVRTNYCTGCKARQDTLEAQAAEIKRLRGVLDALLQHDASSFFGADREKNQRASYRGVIRKAKKARAALGETE